jgi:hypothetical protein
VAEDDRAARRVLRPGRQAAEMLDLFGVLVLDVLLKTVLGRQQMGLLRAIEADQGRAVYIEFAWLDPAKGENRYSTVDVVTVRLEQYRKEWRVCEISPAGVESPLTEARAREILLAEPALLGQDGKPAEPWILPVALFGGALQLPLRQEALNDPVERLFMPGLQQRAFGLISLVGARRLWRDFVRRGEPELDNPEAWAAAVETIMGEQAMRQVTQASVGGNYHVGLGVLLPRPRLIKDTLNISGLDERYSPFGTTRVSLEG